MSEAIIIVRSSRQPVGQVTSPRSILEAAVAGSGLATIEILGQSVLQRTAEELRKAEVGGIAVCVDGAIASDFNDEDADAATTAWASAAEQARQLASSGSDPVFIVELSGYVELDFADMQRVHQQSGRAVTRALHETGPLGVWVANPNMIADRKEIRSVLYGSDAVEYHSSGYVNRLETAADLRRLVNDGLGGRCQCRPQGLEVKPGIWIAPGAVVEKSARIVAPAFIGRGVSISDECLITRGSNIESGSEVDYGTTIEASSILSNTYVGIGLDLSHSIARGSSLFNLQHDVVLHISDPAVMRPNKKLTAGVVRLPLDVGIGQAVTT